MCLIVHGQVYPGVFHQTLLLLTLFPGVLLETRCTLHVCSSFWCLPQGKFLKWEFWLKTEVWTSHSYCLFFFFFFSFQNGFAIHILTSSAFVCCPGSPDEYPNFRPRLTDYLFSWQCGLEGLKINPCCCEAPYFSAMPESPFGFC